MSDDQLTIYTDAEVLRSAARMMDSLQDELLRSDPEHETFAFKSAKSLQLVAHTLRRWATQLEDTGAADRLIKNEAVLTIERVDA